MSPSNRGGVDGWDDLSVERVHVWCNRIPGAAGSARARTREAMSSAPTAGTLMTKQPRALPVAVAAPHQGGLHG